VFIKYVGSKGLTG